MIMSRFYWFVMYFSNCSLTSTADLNFTTPHVHEQISIHIDVLYLCVRTRVHVCMCACVCARMRACLCVCVCFDLWAKEFAMFHVNC